MKNGFLTSEFFSQFPSYAIAAILIYVGMADPEITALIKEAMSGLPHNLQALILLTLKMTSLLGGAYVAGKGAATSKRYVDGRSKIKEKSIDTFY